MKRWSLIFIGLLLVPFWNGAQNTITFYKDAQVDMESYEFHNVRIINNGERYIILAGKNGIHVTDHTFRILEYDSNGNFLSASYIPFLHGYNVCEESEMISDDEVFLRFNQTSPYRRYSCFANVNKGIIWESNDTFYIKSLIKLNDSLFVGINNLDSIKYICGLNYIGKIRWKSNIDSILNNPVSNIQLQVLNHSASVGFSSITDSKKIYFANYTNAGHLIKIDTYSIVETYINDYKRIKNSLLVYSTSKKAGNQSLYLYDQNSKVLWNKTVNEGVLNEIKIFPNANYHIFINYSSDSSSYYEVIILSEKGKVLKDIRLNFIEEDLFVKKSNKIGDSGFFLIANEMISQSQYKYSGRLILMDSNGYAEGGTYSSLQKPKYLYGEIAIFPNPLTTTTTFTLPTLPGQKAEFRLYNITGKLMKQESFTGNFFQLTRGNLPPGLYLYHISVGEKVFTGKVLVE